MGQTQHRCGPTIHTQGIYARTRPHPFIRRSWLKKESYFPVCGPSAVTTPPEAEQRLSLHKMDDDALWPKNLHGGWIRVE